MPKSYKTCEIMQQLEYMTEEQIEKGLDHNAVKDYAYILHDKDKDKDGNQKKPHWHICIRFKDSVPTESICKWFGITENYINKIRGRFGDALAYLTHKNAPEKYQYLEEEVKSNFDFQKEVETIQGRAADKARRQEIVDLITAGIIREYNYTEYITPEEYDRFRKSIDNAFRYRLDKLKGANRNMKVIYIWGASSCGKTTYAKELAAKNDYSVFISSGGADIFDDYKGQDCIIIDDFRPNGMYVSDVLKILDNHTSSTVRARYHNKVLECRLIIITTSLSIEQFFSGLLSDGSESVTQLRRRCELCIKMTPLTMNINIWQSESMRYMYVGSYENPVHGKYVVRDRSQEEAREYVNNLLMFPSKADSETVAKGEGFNPIPDNLETPFSTLSLIHI